MIKMCKLFFFIKNEAKVNKRLFFLAYLLLTATLTAAFFLVYISSNVSKSMYSYIDKVSPEGFEIEIRGLNYSSINITKDIGFSAVYPELLETIDSTNFLFHKQTLEPWSIDAKYFFAANQNVIKGTGYTTAFNDADASAYSVWISEELSTALGIHIGNTIVQALPNNQKIEYVVSGIYDSNEGFAQSDILLPFSQYYKAISSTGKRVEHTMIGILPSSSFYGTVCSKLEHLSLDAASFLDDTLRTVTMIGTLFRVLSLLVSLIGAIAFINIMNIILQNRMYFILMTRMLGNKLKHMLFTYAVLSEALIFVSAFSASLINYCLARQVKEFLSKYFAEINVTSKGLLCFFPVMLLLCSVLLLFPFLQFWKMTGGKNIIGKMEKKV